MYIDLGVNPANCTSSIIKFTTSNSDPDQILKVGMAALLAGKAIQCNVSGCIGNYQKGFQCTIVR